jgi:hypothetical protein
MHPLFLYFLVFGFEITKFFQNLLSFVSTYRRGTLLTIDGILNE